MQSEEVCCHDPPTPIKSSKRVDMSIAIAHNKYNRDPKCLHCHLWQRVGLAAVPAVMAMREEAGEESVSVSVRLLVLVHVELWAQGVARAVCQLRTSS